MRDTWDPAQYERFAAERNAPFFELLALVEPAPGGRAADLGCGTGALTAELHRHLGASETVGIDNLAHVVAWELAGEAPFREVLGGGGRPVNVREPDWYALALDQLGFVEQHVRLQVFLHHLPGPADVVEWVKGTLLTWYQRHLPAELYERFLAAYRERLLERLGDLHPYPYPYKRILFWGRPPGR